MRKLLQEDTDTQVISNCMSVLDKVSLLQQKELPLCCASYFWTAGSAAV